MAATRSPVENEERKPDHWLGQWFVSSITLTPFVGLGWSEGHSADKNNLCLTHYLTCHLEQVDEGSGGRTGWSGFVYRNSCYNGGGQVFTAYVTLLPMSRRDFGQKSKTNLSLMCRLIFNFLVEHISQNVANIFDMWKPVCLGEKSVPVISKGLSSSDLGLIWVNAIKEGHLNKTECIGIR